MNIGVILAAGIGARFKSLVHKQYLKLNGKEVVAYALSRMAMCKKIDKIILVVDAAEYDSHYIENKYHVECICGGATRNQSIKNALDYIKNHYQCELVLFHDATRPLVKSDYYTTCLEAMANYDCVISYQEVTDSLCDAKNVFYNRDSFKLIQTPEVFHFDQLYACFDATAKATAIVAQLSQPKIHFIKSDKFSFKLTYPNDLFLAEQLDKINFYELAKSNTLYNFDHKTVLILGGSGGIGSALVARLKTLRKVKIIAPSVQELNLNGLTVAAINKYCKDCHPDVIINAAAVSFNDSDGLLETFDTIFNVNLKANVVLIEYAKQLNKEVRMIFISSSSSTKGRENITNYSAAKSALNSVVESQAAVLRKNNVYLNAIVPEKINTPMIQRLHQSNIAARELLSVDEVVDAILCLVGSNEVGQLVHLRKGL